MGGGNWRIKGVCASCVGAKSSASLLVLVCKDPWLCTACQEPAGTGQCPAGKCGYSSSLSSVHVSCSGTFSLLTLIFLWTNWLRSLWALCHGECRALVQKPGQRGHQWSEHRKCFPFSCSLPQGAVFSLVYLMLFSVKKKEWFKG